MRAYFFGNFMLSSIQQGIQAAHVVAEMAIQYQYDGSADSAKFIEWAQEHKTIQLMNAGDQTEINSLVDFFDTMHSDHMGGDAKALPWSAFSEDESLNHCTTSCGIIVPDYVRVLSAETGKRPARSGLCGINENIFLYRDDTNELLELELSEFEIQLADRLKKYRYAI